MNLGWYIPPSWLENTAELPETLSISPRTALEATELAFFLARSQSRTMDHSSIPLIVHQSIASIDPHAWTSKIQDYVERWLAMCAGEEYLQEITDEEQSREMAYILWDDHGIDQMMMAYEGKFLNSYNAMPMPVERVDMFRVAVLRWFGGLVRHTLLACCTAVNSCFTVQ